MNRAGNGPTKPAAGVMVARPAIDPVAAPNMVGLPRWSHSVTIQAIVAAEAAVWVATNAEAASVPDVRALPALKPNQPNQSSPAPSTVNGRLCGGMDSRRNPFRLPMKRAAARAENPDVAWTTIPPAKSSTPRSLSQPPVPHTQWATGSYTSVVHARVK